MVTLVRGQPFSTDVPAIVIDAGLPLGRHAFQLVVQDEAGNVSVADQHEIEIQRLIVVGPRDPVFEPRDPIFEPQPDPVIRDRPILEPRQPIPTPTPTPTPTRGVVTDTTLSPVRPTPTRPTAKRRTAASTTSKKRKPK